MLPVSSVHCGRNQENIFQNISLSFKFKTTVVQILFKNHFAAIRMQSQWYISDMTLCQGNAMQAFHAMVT